MSKSKKETVIISKVAYLQQIKTRFEDEVGTYFNLLNQYHALSERKIGFWSSIRLIMPVVETTAKCVQLSPQELLKKLGIITPHLVWEMYRHPLTHGDQIPHIKYKNREINWGLTISSGKGTGHIIGHDHISIDINYLYTKLVLFLTDEIQKNDVSSIEVEIGIIYDNNASRYILEDLEKVKMPFSENK